MPAGKQLPSVPYVEGKYFFFRQQYDKALAALKQIRPDHVYYFHSHYFVGAAQRRRSAASIARRDPWRSARSCKTPAKTDSQKRITELAHLALARIYYDRGQFTNALDEYAKIGTKSEFFNDALYESGVGQHQGQGVRQGGARARPAPAQRARLARSSPRSSCSSGSLHIRGNEYEPATESFAKTRDEYRAGASPALRRDR